MARRRGSENGSPRVKVHMGTETCSVSTCKACQVTSRLNRAYVDLQELEGESRWKSSLVKWTTLSHRLLVLSLFSRRWSLRTLQECANVVRYQTWKVRVLAAQKQELLNSIIRDEYKLTELDQCPHGAGRYPSNTEPSYTQ